MISYIGYKAFSEEDKGKTDIFIYSSMFLTMLLLIDGFFDVIQIFDSRNENERLCSTEARSSLEIYADLQSFECSFTPYYITVGLTFISALLLLISAHTASKWRLELPKVSDNL
eukprot:TRINITY_DN3064_c0_g1_i9.p2 TRINITY_DN3064_c0_g1~~TRINITY_DN3064_c0_g1_i9.p2  ORF type:complete len:114 (+),score=26.92 TRINITY_DN3064_c0_g1_i9:163-504(+)